jgi:hypothetical protein
MNAIPPGVENLTLRKRYNRDTVTATRSNPPQRHREHREKKKGMQEKPEANRDLPFSFVCSFNCFPVCLCGGFVSLLDRTMPHLCAEWLFVF